MFEDPIDVPNDNFQLELVSRCLIDQIRSSINYIKIRPVRVDMDIH